MGIDKSNPFDREPGDIGIDYGPGGRDIEVKTEPGVAEGVPAAVLKGTHGSLSDIDPMDGSRET